MSQIQNPSNGKLQKKLENELERLQHILKLGHELTVKWIPQGSSKLSGEVKNGTILIYEENEDVAIETLKHEVIDFAVSQAVEPYKEVTNRFIALVNEQAYKKKEEIVERLTALL